MIPTQLSAQDAHLPLAEFCEIRVGHDFAYVATPPLKAALLPVPDRLKARLSAQDSDQRPEAGQLGAAM